MVDHGPDSRITAVRVALALLSVRNGRVEIALAAGSAPALPTNRPDSGDSLDLIAREVMTTATGSDAGYFEQLYTFTFQSHNSSEIVVSYLALAPEGTSLSEGFVWLEADGSIAIPASDAVVLDYALVRLRAKIGYSTIAFHLMPEAFTLSDLQQTYETILGRPLDPRNFRRRMVSSGLLQAENRQRRQGSHRPAALYRFAGYHDPGSFLTPTWSDHNPESNDHVGGKP